MEGLDVKVAGDLGGFDGLEWFFEVVSRHARRQSRVLDNVHAFPNLRPLCRLDDRVGRRAVDIHGNPRPAL